MAYPLYEVIAEHGMPAIFHTGHSGMGTGMRGGGGVRLKYGQPMLVDDVAVDFPDMKIILAHPELALDRRKSVDGAAQGERLHRSVRLDAKILSQTGRPIRQYAAEAQRCCSARTSR